MAAPTETRRVRVRVDGEDMVEVRLGGADGAALRLTPEEARLLHAELGAHIFYSPGVVRKRARLASGPSIRRPIPNLWKPRVAVVVPFREQTEQGRGAQLARFLEMMPEWLGLPRGAARVFVAVQPEDGRKFNRGLLLNVGARAAMHAGFKTLVLHDVDLLPSDDLKPWYVRTEEPATALHIGARWDRYTYPGYLGGVLKVGAHDFVAANGFPNTFWGWGGEDDAFASRLKAAGVRVAKPTEGSLTDLEANAAPSARASTRIKDGGREEWRNMTRREDLARDRGEWRKDGLSSLDALGAPRILLDTPLCFKVEAPTGASPPPRGAVPTWKEKE